MLIENFDPNYVLFEKAAELEHVGLAPITFVPIEVGPDGSTSNPVSRGIAEVMARHARLSSWQVIAIRQEEPIVLNAASQIASKFSSQRIRSIIILTGAFRSRRSFLVYGTVLGEAGIAVYCVPVYGRSKPDDWFDTWHGIQEVIEQQAKLQYYRLWVLPFLRGRPGG
jgi:hypothetical protein